MKGVKNKTPELRALIAEALDRAGGVDYLVRQAQENPGPFLQLLGRMIPKEITAEISGELTVRQEVRRELIDRLVILMARPGQQGEPVQTVIESRTEAAAVLPVLNSRTVAGLLASGEQGRAPHACADSKPVGPSGSS